jgi:ribosomal protein S24E
MVSESSNPILKRKELSFFIDHTSLGSPRLTEVRKSLAEKFGVNEDLVYILKLDTRTGTNRTYGGAEIYDTLEMARAIVPQHIQMRNSPSRRGEKG